MEDRQQRIDFEALAEAEREDLELLEALADIEAEYHASVLARLPDYEEVSYEGRLMGVPGSRLHASLGSHKGGTDDGEGV